MKTMRLHNLRVYTTTGVVPHYSGELVDTEDHFYVKFDISAGGKSAIAYDPKSDCCYDIISINGTQNFDPSTWRDGDFFEIFAGVTRQTGILL